MGRAAELVDGRSSLSMPAPVSAEVATPHIRWPPLSPASGRHTVSPFSSPAGKPVHLFMMRSCGISAAPISARTLSTCACARAEGDEASTTCSTSAASVTSSRVARNAFTGCGQIPDKPTVSLTARAGREGRRAAARGVEGGEHARIHRHARLGERLNRVDLPALV